MHFQLLTQSDDFAKSIAFAWWPFLAIFKMLSFFEYSLSFGAVFCIEQLQCVVETFLACFYAFLMHKKNALIFRIFAVFWSRFLHRTTAMWCRNVFSMF